MGPLEQSWEDLSVRFHHDLPDGIEDITKRAFYAGAATVLNMLIHAPDTGKQIANDLEKNLRERQNQKGGQNAKTKRPRIRKPS
jgi:hypothetical protein